MHAWNCLVSPRIALRYVSMSLVWFPCELGGCELCFTVQPSDSLECDPYLETSISLECKIEGPYSPIPKIAWFSKFQPGEIIEIRDSDSGYSIVNTTEFEDTIRTTQSVLTIQEFSEGEYWCDIYVEGIVPKSSQRLCITEQGDYKRYPKCSSAALSREDPKCWSIPDTCVTEMPTIMASSSYNSASINSALPINSNGVQATQLFRGSSTLLAATALPTKGGTTSRGSPSQTDELEGLVDTPKEFETWLYIVASLAGLFAILILVLIIICIGLCFLYPRTYQKPAHSRGKTLTVAELHLIKTHMEYNCKNATSIP